MVEQVAFRLRIGTTAEESQEEVPEEAKSANRVFQTEHAAAAEEGGEEE